MKRFLLVLLMLFVFVHTSEAQDLTIDPQMYEIIDSVSADRLESDIKTLANFGTRHTMSDTTSSTRGIGAARRWIKQEFEAISDACGGCLEVHEQRTLVEADPDSRINEDTWVVNVYAVLKGNTHPNRYVIMSGDIDSRASDVMNDTIDAPGANDNATGMAGAIEAARVLSDYEFENTIIFAGLSGEEQGLYGGRHMAGMAKEEGWEIIGVLNNDMIGNIQGIDGVIDNREFRIFSEPYSANATERELQLKRFYGGENDGKSRQLARYIYETTELYMPQMDPMLIYRLDRFGRGGHHRPFNEAGFAGVRIMEAHENYTQQHQDIRTEDGIEYGDVIEHVNFNYAKKLTAVNAVVMSSLAKAPPKPENVEIGGAVEPSTTLRWEKPDSDLIKGYKIYWRPTSEPLWESQRYVGDVSEFTLENIVIDNYLFGVSAIGKDGHESVVAYPSGLIRD
ncbi:M28 family metallopeptidase [Aliifodinibius salicampi]|uniref:M28 family metallopeptidase n=1 Tax=Fodinibius salicampi TaxID=1920655 RepID=A0ABT3Q0C6_9BACT|nr:M28 family metallopeptidase [Fodinibius salicampi]MCW9713541.1 M28 family metallopeptidase [Fodinibius salicampi]